jgi:hypothetical protein
LGALNNADPAVSTRRRLRLAFFRSNRLKRGDLLAHFRPLTLGASKRLLLLVLGYLEIELKRFFAFFAVKRVCRHIRPPGKDKYAFYFTWICRKNKIFFVLYRVRSILKIHGRPDTEAKRSAGFF